MPLLYMSHSIKVFPFRLPKSIFKSSLPTRSNFHLFVCFSLCPVCLFAPFDSHKYKYDDVYIFIVCVSFYTYLRVCVYFALTHTHIHRTRTGITRTSLASRCALPRSTQSHVPRQGFAWHRSHSEDRANIFTLSSKGRGNVCFDTSVLGYNYTHTDTHTHIHRYYSVLMQLRP